MMHRSILLVEDIPVFQNKMFATEAAALACPKGTVNLVEDMDTGLVFNAAFDAALLDYDTNYQNEQGYSGVFQRHLDAVREIIEPHFSGKSLIEIGCGKGYFLEHMQKHGYDITGIDPAYEGDSPFIVKACFEPGLGLSADVVILRHVLEHIPDPVTFLSSIARANGDKGIIYLEVPCIDWICRHRAWFDIFYEHVNYFRLSDFRRMFGTVHEAGHLFGGQYLYVVADLSTMRPPHTEEQDAVRFPDDFLTGIQDVIAGGTTGKRKAIWGGAAKGTMFAFYMKRAGITVDLVVDINPAKQGKFLPSSGLRVLSPEDAMQILQQGDNVFVMNSNYYGEIIAKTNNLFHYVRVDNYELC